MPKNNKKNKKIQPQVQLYVDMLGNTVRELCTDLKKIDADKGSALETVVSGLDNHKVVKRLAKSDSDLCRCIPVELLENDASGRKYLDILSTIQPLLKPKSVPIETNAIVATTANVVPSVVKEIDEYTKSKEFMKMFNSSMDAELLDLADSVRKDINLNEQEIHEMVADMDMTKMMGLIGKISSTMNEKVQKGEIDVDKMQSQAMSFVEKIKENPEFSKTLQENPSLSMMMNGTSSLGALGSLGSLGSMGGFDLSDMAKMFSPQKDD